MANRFIGGVLSSRPQANTPFVSRASTGTYFDNAGVMRTAPINQPRLNYNFVGSAWTQPTVLIEPSSTNLLLYSTSLSNGVWTQDNITIASGISAPDGTTNAFSMTENTSNTNHRIYQLSIPAGKSITISIFAKYVSRQYLLLRLQGEGTGPVSAMANFDIQNGQLVDTNSNASSATIQNVGNGWYRCSLTSIVVNANQPTVNVVFAANNSSSAQATNPQYAGSGQVTYFFAPQAELTYGPTSYIPTSGSTVTRAADVVGPYSSGIFGLEDRQNSTSNDDQFTVTSFTTTGSTTWTAPQDVTSVEVLVVAGGGGGGSDVSGGGGGGGVLYYPSYTVIPGTTYPIVVGAGGAGQAFTATGWSRGGNSQFGSVIAYGGGGGGSWVSAYRTGQDGGSGGGSYGSTGGQGVAGQGYQGGSTGNGGGGGAGGPGSNASVADYAIGTRAPGLKYNITGSLVEYGYGGAGSNDHDQGSNANGTANTGGGGDGGGGNGYSGGSGIVVVKYRRTPRQISSTSNTAIVTQKFSTTNLWTVPAGVTQVEALVVAGGGGGGYGRDVTNTGSYGAGGGGAGGLVYSSALTVTPGSTYAIGVGTGGLGAQGTTGAANQGYSGFGSGIGTGTELITNGSAFTVTTGWTATTATLSVPQTGTFRILPNASVNGTASQSITTVNGTTYVAVVKVTNDISKQFRLRIGTTQVGNEITDFFTGWTNTSLDNGTTGSGFYSTTFTATGSTTWINMQVGGGTQQPTDISYISVRQATLPATGGGGGGGVSNSSTYQSGLNGGSGGGAGSWNPANGTPGSAVSGQGNAGGTGITSGSSAGEAGGGGGGAGSAGLNAIFAKAGNGGTGLPYNITGNLEYYAGGGGGGSDLSATLVGQGGFGGGGGGNANGLVGGNAAGANGAPNTGGGGGGAGASSAGGSGGSGVVILRYRVPQVATFLDSGAWTCPSGVTSVQALVVAGGGGGSGGGGGGGGAGGVLYSSSISVTPGVTYPVVVGQGGNGGVGPNGGQGTNGANSAFASLIAIGGGYGATPYAGTQAGATGGSGGGGTGAANGATGSSAVGGGTYGQGNSGGVGYCLTGNYVLGGGGGGSGAAGSTYSGTTAGNGGAGLAYAISGTSVTYGGGGGGGIYVTGTAGSGGAGGGGAGANGAGTAGTANTGGGGGGSNYASNAGIGGSGIVILRWYGA